MADKKAPTLPDLASARPIPADVRLDHGRMRTSLHKAIVDAADGDGTTYEVARLPSHARVSRLSKLYHPNLGAGSAIKLGIEHENAGADAALIASGATTSASSKDAASAMGVDKIGLPLWQLIGLDRDPGEQLSVILTLTTAGGTGGEVAVDLVYIVD